MRSLLFVVNPRSGGRAGPWLLARLRERVPAEHVLTIDEADIPAIARLLAERSDRGALIACGGDGTAAAVIEACWLADPRKPVPVGTLPLGTGNDLARHLGWRPRRGLQPLTHLDHQLHALQFSPLVGLDRWVLSGAGITQPFYNYLSLGADARVAARFHTLRRDAPWLFRSPAVNKAIYGGAALSEPALRLSEVLDLGPGGPELPSWTRALVLCNVTSYAGGSRLSPRIRGDDGWIDGFALGPAGAMALALARLRRPRAVIRSAVVHFRLHTPLIAQFDGEPHRLPAGHYTVAHGGRARVISSPG